MANNVYNTVCEALSRIVSRRAAENIVREALRGAKTDPNRVTAEEMQTLLKSAVFARLQQIIPVAQAKGEIKLILNQLERSFQTAKPSAALSPEVLEGLAALQNEFRPYAKLSQPRAQRLLKSIQELPGVEDPVKMLNTLWAELDLLQLELSGRSLSANAKGSDARNLDDLLLSSGEYAINYEFDELPPEPVAPRADDPQPAVVTTPSAAPTATIASAVAAIASELVSPVAPPSNAKRFDLETPDGREAMLSHFALEEGVVGVLLTDRRGQVIAERLSSGEADQLAAVVAATTLLLEKRRGFQLFYTHLAEVSAFIGLAGKRLVTVLSDDRVNVGRVLSELASLKEDV
jgi:hypothetical protein